MKAKNRQNYLDFVPVKNPDIEYHTDDSGIVTLLIEWKGFYHRIAQKFFHRPRISETLSSFFRFPGMEKSLSRLIKFLEILRDSHLIQR